ncbi:TPA: hypothetical protein N0F65_010396 [Lagenidium giganteum]|uniref:Uncharacterized protein n=1 Tax=Lagenidium giganteum TaxID=4803 RepID=A0AAV2YVH7_9STRA|nr:TPA: hypothetical protein N0F65_010396 [Lagenidium giganteum]
MQPTTHSLAKLQIGLSAHHPSLTPLKRKLSDDDNNSPTSLDEILSVSTDDSIISPKKKAKTVDEEFRSKLEMSSFIASVPNALFDLELESQDPCMEVLAAYVPVAFEASPATPLDDSEMDILNYFLS